MLRFDPFSPFLWGLWGELAGRMDYAAVGQAVSRFGKRLQQRAALRKNMAKIENKLSTVDSAEKTLP